MTSSQFYPSWGRYIKATQHAHPMLWQHEGLPDTDYGNGTLLPYGNGRSYGDVCLNNAGTLIDCRPLNHFMQFDSETGLLRCEAGVLFSDILARIVSQGWFLPVTPGTQFVTIGGAIANDVHGKNHHRAGTLGCHIRAFELLRSDQQRYLCTPEQNADLFKATIGGLGLTGLILWAEIQLKPVMSNLIDQEIIRYRNLNEFFQLCEDSDQGFEYTVAWVDCLAKGEELGRGLFYRGNHAETLDSSPHSEGKKKLRVPFDPPISLINKLSLKAFNSFYYYKQQVERKASRLHYAPFFYPLDSILEWNRIYGPKGFLQYQCVVPVDQGKDAIEEILKQIASSGMGSFLAVLKVFGDIASPGMMSFPRPGVTLALDFPNQGKKTLQLLDKLDQVVASAGGAVYPAKDARLSEKHFQTYYPQWEDFQQFKDPAFSSSFWRRVTGQ